MIDSPDMSASSARRGKNRPVYLMISLLLMLLIQPALAGKPFSSLVLVLLLSLVGISSALSVFRNRRLFVTICCLGLPCVGLNWMTRLADVGVAMDVLTNVLLIAFTGTLLTAMLINILATSTVTANTLCRAVSAYLLIGLTWAAAYEIVVMLDPGAITPLTSTNSMGNFVYFSFTTMTTLGFGDITPVSPYARSLAMLQSVIGPMYLVILVARLVAMYGRTPTGQQS